MRVIIGLGVGVALASSVAWGQTGAAGWRRPAPDVADARYGPHERNLLDLWKARSSVPSPLVVYFHGGAFRSGDKTNIPEDILRECLSAGISVASANYRLSKDAPYPAPMRDGALAVQYLRMRAKEWNIDPGRIAGCGSSAGGGIALWVGFRDEMADPKSADPVLRQSTRLSCVAGIGAQTSYDPRWIKSVIGGRCYQHPALFSLFGLKPDERDTQKAYALYEDASALTHLNAGDPPAFLYYTESKKPLSSLSLPGAGIHHPKFGEALKEKMDKLGIECVVRHRDDYKESPPAASAKEMAEFFSRVFGRTHPARGQ